MNFNIPGRLGWSWYCGRYCCSVLDATKFYDLYHDVPFYFVSLIHPCWYVVWGSHYDWPRLTEYSLGLTVYSYAHPAFLFLFLFFFFLLFFFFSRFWQFVFVHQDTYMIFFCVHCYIKCQEHIKPWRPPGRLHYHLPPIDRTGTTAKQPVNVAYRKTRLIQDPYLIRSSNRDDRSAGWRSWPTSGGGGCTTQIVDNADWHPRLSLEFIYLFHWWSPPVF